MGREVRRVPADWQHPRYSADDAPHDKAVGRFKPLNDGYADTAARFMEMATEEEYMPDWPEADRTHFMMYEDTSEGTPISPAFATPEELARWLADTGASSFGSMTASYEAWLRVAKGGFAPSAVIGPDGFQSGVEALAEVSP